MYIVFGTRPYFRRNTVVQHGFCNFCDNFAKFTSFDARRFFHLYYIPLIPTEGSRRNHKLCPKCNMGQIYEPQAFGDIVTELKDQTADAIVALQSGETTFLGSNPEADPLECVPFLHSVLDWLYASNNVDFCDSIVKQLEGPNCRFAHAMLNAALETMRGNIDKAVAAYKEAAVIDTKSLQPWQMMAHLLVVRRKPDEAIEAYRSALALATDKASQVALNLQLVDQEMATKRFADAAATYDRIVQLRPDLAKEPAIAKAMKKAKKKAGLP